MIHFTRFPTNRKLFAAIPDRLLLFAILWIINRITAYPYSRWRSRLVDRLLTAVEGGGENA